MAWNNDRRLVSEFDPKGVSVPEEWSDAETARAVQAAPEGKIYKGYIRGSKGVQAVYGQNVRPGGVPAEMRQPVRPAVTSADVAAQEAPSEADRMVPRVTAREVLYGARATNPRAEVGRLGREQKSWEKYLAARVNRSNPLAVSALDRDRGWMGTGNRVQREAAVTAADIAGRTNAMAGQKQADRDLARQVKQQDMNIAMGRFVMDMEDAGYKRSLRPMDEMGKELGIEGQRQGIMSQIQARQQAEQKQTWEAADRPLKMAGTMQDLAGKAASEQRAQEDAARAGEKWSAEKQGWAVGQGVPAPGAEAAPTPVGSTAGSRGKLDGAKALEYVKAAGGDKVKARQLAMADGWSY